MNITILTDNPNSWIIPHVEELKQLLSNHKVKHIFSQDDIKGGDIMFILSCEKIIPEEQLNLHTSNIVVHPSNLPEGKGWSPLAWQILEGKNTIPVCLFEASPKVDSGNIYLKDIIELDGSELNDEIKFIQGKITIKLILKHLENIELLSLNKVPSQEQKGKETFYPKFKRENNELDINKSIKDQFNILRTVDNKGYPAFFNLDGNEYTIKIYKNNNPEMKLVKCSKKYWEYVRILRNDKRVVDGFIENIHITKEMQEKYMEKNSKYYYIVLIDNKPCGYIGEIDGDIRVCTHPDYQGKGIGAFMIKELTKVKPDIYARIKIDNIASVKAFEKAGYEKKYFVLEPKK